MFGLCFLSALNAQEESFNKSLPLATTPNDFTLSPVTNAESDRHSSDSSPVAPSALDDAVAQAFAGVAALTELNHQHQRALQQTLSATGQNTRATELLGQVVTAQSGLLIDVQKVQESFLGQLEALRLAREEDRQAQCKKEDEANTLATHQWYLELKHRELVTAELAALRLAREEDRQAQRKKDEANRLANHKWYLEISNQSGRNEALALIGGVLFGIGFAYQVMLDNINGGSSGHH